MSLMDTIKAKAKSDQKHILLPEGAEERTVQAAARITAEGIAKVTLFGKREDIQAVADKFGVSLDGIDTIDLLPIPITSATASGSMSSAKPRALLPKKRAI